MNDKRFLRLISCILLLTVVIFFNGTYSLAQQMSATKSETGINIDGVLDESVWQNAAQTTGFYQFQPKHGEPASQRTVVRMVYTNDMLFFGFYCFDTEIDRLSARVTRRDADVEDDDAVGVFLDTFNDDNNAYFFIVNSIGTQKDGRYADNGRTQDDNWDGKWSSAAAVHSDGWSAEIGIPFQTLKFNSEATEWGMNFGRAVPRNLEVSFWVKDMISTQRVSQFGQLTGLDLTEVVAKKYTLIPYVQAQFEGRKDPDGRAGLDLRYSLASNLGLDATVNPDFATIEADVERTNLTRFEISYPEKRPFFQEGSENYSTRIRQFYSRRIGEIPWGVKINGKYEEWKINALTTQSDPYTAGANVTEGKDANYTVFRVNREFGQGSNIGLIGANRYYRSENTGSVGLVATLFFTDVLGMTSQVIKSHGAEDNGTWTYFFRPSYDSEYSHFHVRYTHVGEGVRENVNPVGYISDDNRKEFDTNIRREFWINKNGIESIQPSVNYNRYWSQNGDLRSWDLSSSIEFSFFKKWSLDISHNADFKAEYLPIFEKDFENNMIEVELDYDSKTGKEISFAYGKGKNYDSDVEEATGSVDLKLSEGWNASYSLTRLWFRPETDEESSWRHLIRSTYYFTNDMYFKAFYQSKYAVKRLLGNVDYELDRENIQLVFVWRFLPPFGSVQFAYQEGATRITETDNRSKTFFTKFSWVF
ncbi:DUF5916 domain-containing protein [candidate division KSB1 bacterium]